MTETGTVAAETTPATRRKRNRKQGTVVSAAMTKSIVVRVDRLVRHAKYGKFIRRRSQFMAHDEHGQAGVGDRVEIIETKPLSKRKRWRLLRVVEKAK